MIEAAGGGSPARYLAVAVSSLVVVILPSYLMGTLAVSMEPELGITPALLGLLMACRFGAAALSSAAAGRWVERLGPTLGMRLPVLAMAATMAAIGLFVHDPPLLALLLMVCGVALATVQPAADVWVARGVPATHQGLAFGVKQAAVPASALLAGAAVPTALAVWGWRPVWVVAGCCALLAAAAVPWRAHGTGGGVGRARLDRSGDECLGSLVWLAVAFGLGSVAVVNLTTFLVVAAVDAGLSVGTAGMVFGVCGGVGILTRLVVGRWADRTRIDLLLLIAVIQTVGAVCFVVLGLVGGNGYVVAAPLAFAVGLSWPGLLMLAVVRGSPNAPGAATSIVNTGSFIGSIAGPVAFGLLVTHVDYGVGWALTALCLVAAAGAALTARRLRRSDGYSLIV